MGWTDFIRCTQFPVVTRTPPKVIVIHLGGNDLPIHALRFLFKAINDAVDYMAEAFPDAKLVWVEILDRLNWGVSKDELKAIYLKRKRLNQFGRRIFKGENRSVLKVDIDTSTPGFYRGDGIHLSDVGLDMYNDAIREHLITLI